MISEGWSFDEVPDHMVAITAEVEVNYADGRRLVYHEQLHRDGKPLTLADRLPSWSRRCGVTTRTR
jgi:hypothetical protein